MSQRFFSDEPIEGESAVLAGAEAHHLLHVMRAAVGDEVLLFDGRGAEYAARIRERGRSEVRLEVLERRDVCRESAVALTLGVALPKGDRQRWLVEKTTELGAARLVPLVTTRGVAQPDVKTLDKLRRAVIEASKQCGRNRLMEIAEPQPVAEFLQKSICNLRVIAHPDAEATDWTRLLSGAKSVAAAIGPEGGFSDQEVNQAAAAGWTRVSLGERILRVETAALALAAHIAR